MRRRRVLAVVGVVIALAGCTDGTAAVGPGPRGTLTPTTVPASSWRPAHVVVVVEENRSYNSIVGSSSAPYLNALIAGGASLSRIHAIRHPSQPNYLALFSGSTHGLATNSCPHDLGGPTIVSQFAAARRRVIGYAEDLPRAGDLACAAGRYARKHAPWTNFPALDAAEVGWPFTAWPTDPTDYATLPDVAFVIPDLLHDMHDGSIWQGDKWLQQHVSSYARWARTHNSVLIVTWDEDDDTERNRIPTIVFGAHVRHVTSSGRTDLYGLLRTVEWLFGLPGIGAARTARPITDIWTGS